MRIGYCRVSTEEQNLARQEDLMAELNVEKIFMEKASGKSSKNRPVLKEAIDYAREGDVFVVSDISRLARNTRDLLKIVDSLEEKKVQFISQKEAIDTSTPQGKFVLTVFGALAELELGYIRQRQAEGIAIAKKNGKYIGRQKQDYDKVLFAQLYPVWKDGEITAKAFMKRGDLLPATFYRRVREYELNMDIDIFS